MATSNAADRPGSSATGGEASPPNGPLPEAYVVRSFSRPLISTRMPVMAIPLSKSLIDAVEVGDNITCKFMARANKWGNTSQFGEAEVRISAKGEELEVERGLSGLSSLQGLCNTCARFLTSENWAKGSYEGPLRVFAKVFVSYFGHLAVASAQNCRICRVIVAEMVKARGPLAANEEIEVEYWIHSTLPHWHLRVFPRIRGEAYHLAVCRFHLWGEPIRQLNSPFSSGSAYSLSLTSSSFGTTSMARKWLQSCVHNHTACKRKRDSSWVPPRLLDLSRRNIRLVCFEDEEATKKPYAALSYCWGSDPNVFTLTASNLDAFRTGLPEDKLATAIKEAIQLCRSLSFDYLWVDSLCIIQSGKGSKEDWLRHAREMQFVYANCLLCISSSRAPNPSESMFAERDPAAWIQPTVETSGKKFTLLDEHGFRQRRRLAPTAKRGWILQERMMAPRVLSFETEQVFWDCEELQNACETFTTGPPCSLETDAIPFSLPDAVSEEDGHKMWLSIVEEYTGRALSRPDDDKLLALTAVAQQMSKLLDDQYVAGMFLKRLWLFLVGPRHQGRQSSGASCRSSAVVELGQLRRTDLPVPRKVQPIQTSRVLQSHGCRHQPRGYPQPTRADSLWQAPHASRTRLAGHPSGWLRRPEHLHQRPL